MLISTSAPAAAVLAAMSAILSPLRATPSASWWLPRARSSALAASNFVEKPPLVYCRHQQDRRSGAGFLAHGPQFPRSPGQARLSGVANLSATISTDGRIQTLEAISGVRRSSRPLLKR
jgi:hypothetical protein